MTPWHPAGAAGKPLVIAHRGASSAFTENTEAAFSGARRLGADGIELDIRQCQSGQLVVFHDPDLERLAHRPGIIAKLPLSALREVQVGGDRILTLDDAIEVIGPDMAIDIEIKSDRLGSASRAALRLAEILARHGEDCCGRVIVSSFDPSALVVFRLGARGSGIAVATALLFHGDQALPLSRGWAARVLRPAAVAPHHTLVGANTLTRWRQAGRAVWTWTVDDPARISALAAAGVDAIITNDPETALRIVRRDGRAAGRS